MERLLAWVLTRKDIEESDVDGFCTTNDICQLINEITRPASGTLLDHNYINRLSHC